MKPRVTIRDISREAGVHYSTVSLALRNSPRISAEVRTRVCEVAERLGYVPDPMLSALTAYRKTTRPVHYQATLAWLNNWGSRKDLRKITVFDEYYRGAEARAAELGYKLEELWLREPGMSPEKAQAVLNARNINGILLAPQELANTSLDMDFTAFSVVAFGYSLKPHVFDLVTNHQTQTMHLALGELDALGYRRIGFYFKEDWDDKVDNSYFSAFLLYQNRHPDRVVPYLMRPEIKEAEFTEWFTKTQPDVVITGDLRIVPWIEATGKRVPKDVGVATLSLRPTETHFSGTHQNDLLIGRAAVDILVGMIQRGQRGIPVAPTRTLLESHWIPGHTVRKQRVG